MNGWNILENVLPVMGWGYFIWYVEIEYKDAELFWVAITFKKEQFFESHAFFYALKKPKNQP